LFIKTLYNHFIIIIIMIYLIISLVGNKLPTSVGRIVGNKVGRIYLFISYYQGALSF